MPLPILLVTAVAAAVSLAVAGLFVVRRFVPPATLEVHNEVVGYVYSILSVLYGVLLAFVVVSVWERYVDAREIVEREANALGDLFRDAQVYPQDARTRIRSRIRAYTRVVLADEWRTMEVGLESVEAWRAYDAIWQEYHAFEPTTPSQWLWHERGIERLNDLGDERRLRLLRSQSTLPGLLLGVLYTLGIVIVAFSYLFGVRRFGMHALLIAVLAGSLALILIVLSALEHPFGRLAPVDPAAFNDALAAFERWTDL